MTEYEQLELPLEWPVTDDTPEPLDDDEPTD